MLTIVVNHLLALLPAAETQSSRIELLAQYCCPIGPRVGVGAAPSLTPSACFQSQEQMPTVPDNIRCRGKCGTLRPEECHVLAKAEVFGKQYITTATLEQVDMLGTC